MVNCQYDSKKQYTKIELNKIAMSCGIKNAQKILKHDLVQLLNNMEVKKNEMIQHQKIENVEKCVSDLLAKCDITSSKVKSEIHQIIKNNHNIIIPTNIESIPVPLPENIPKPPPPSYETNNYIAFSDFFKNDFLSFINKPTSKPKLRAFVPGGYGLKMIFEHKYNDFTKIKTNDLDITVSINDTTLSDPIKAKDYLINKCSRFIKSRKDPNNFKIQVISLPTTYNPILKMRRFYVVSVLYKNDEFVDLAITDRQIHIDEMNVKLSNKCSLPIKKDEGYFHEYFQIIYMENVPGVDHYCYLKRNPITGKFSCKGVKDIERVKALCVVSNTKTSKYFETCKLVQQVDKESLKKLTQSERDKVFVSLRDLI